MGGSSKTKSRKGAFWWALALLAAVIIAFVVFASPALASADNEETGYNVVITDNGVSMNVVTESEDPYQILTEGNVTVNPKDRVNLSSFLPGEGGEISIERCNTVYLVSDMASMEGTYEVYDTTVGGAVDTIGIDLEKYTVNLDEDYPVEDGMVISIENSLQVEVEYRGETRTVSTSGGTVARAVEMAGFNVESYRTEPEVDKRLKDNMHIVVHDYEVKVKTVTETTEYETERVNDKDLDKGKTKVKTKGKNGKSEVTYEIEYLDGKESSRTVLEENVINKVVNEVILVGTATFDNTPNGVKSKNGYKLGQKISGRYTHYCACKKCCGKTNGITASGLKVYNGMDDPHYIACNWLPLGSIVEINGIEYLVADRGGSSLSRKGRVDIYTPAGHKAALRAGTGNCTLTIVRLGW